jgi:predicted nucleotidyltransferase
VFGSRARGDSRADSDYDIAVFLRDMPDRADEFGRLAEAYKFKEIADYGTGPRSAVTAKEAQDLIVQARDPVETITQLLAADADHLDQDKD